MHDIRREWVTLTSIVHRHAVECRAASVNRRYAACIDHWVSEYRDRCVHTTANLHRRGINCSVCHGCLAIVQYNLDVERTTLLRQHADRGHHSSAANERPVNGYDGVRAVDCHSPVAEEVPGRHRVDVDPVWNVESDCGEILVTLVRCNLRVWNGESGIRRSRPCLAVENNV